MRSRCIKVGEARESKQGPYIPVDQSTRRSVNTVQDLYSRSKPPMQHINSHLCAFPHCLDHFDRHEKVHVPICDLKILRKCSEPRFYRQHMQDHSLVRLRTEQTNCVGNLLEEGVSDVDFWGLVWQLMPTTE